MVWMLYAGSSRSWGHGQSRRVSSQCEYALDIRVDGLDPVAEASFDSFERVIHEAKWQSRGPHNPRTCPSGNEPRLSTYTAWFARPATTYYRTLFTIPGRLPLPPKCVWALLRFRKGCYNLPKDVGCRDQVPRECNPANCARLDSQGMSIALFLNARRCRECAKGIQMVCLWIMHGSSMVKPM